MSIAEKGMELAALEKEIYRRSCEIGCAMLGGILAQLDERLMGERDRKEYRHKGKRQTVLKTIMGEVTYARSVYEQVREDGQKQYVYLLDEALGMANIGYISDLLASRIAEASCEMPYRKAAQAVSELTGQSISHAGAWNVVQAIGEKMDEGESEAAARAKTHNGSGRTAAKLLFEEQDGVYLNLQGKDRTALGKSAEMKMAIAYTGAKKTGEKRYNLVGKVACANFEGIDAFFARKEGIIAETYNVDEIELRILNGDGANWIRRSVTDDTVHYQLDTFHRNKAILQHISDPSAREVIFDLLYSREIDLLLTVIEAYADSAEDEKVRENYLQLLTYFRNNRGGLISYKRRGLDLPPPPDGVVYRACGAMESNVYSLIGRRMKRRRANWSIRGGNNLARLLTRKATDGLSEALARLTSAALPARYEEETVTSLSAAKVPQRIGRGYNGFAKASIPPSQKWMKELFAMRPI